MTCLKVDKSKISFNYQIIWKITFWNTGSKECIERTSRESRDIALFLVTSQCLGHYAEHYKHSINIYLTVDD